MTYKKPVPENVFSRWTTLNNKYTIDFSLDEDCISFLEQNFNPYIVNLFKTIPEGMYKADLWRLCKLYIHGGVYADVDLVPYINIDDLNKDITFYSCLSKDNSSIFQALIINFSKPKNPLLLHFLISFLLNHPYKKINGPTHDMYNCIKYNLNDINIIPEERYDISEIKIYVEIGRSDTFLKGINLHFFPDNIKFTVKLTENKFKDTFDFIIKNNVLIVMRLDEHHGWEHNHSVNICIKSNESIFLFKENIGENNNWVTSYVTLDNKKILDSRDLYYYTNKGW
jgi:hypothetical protein